MKTKFRHHGKYLTTIDEEFSIFHGAPVVIQGIRCRIDYAEHVIANGKVWKEVHVCTDKEFDDKFKKDKQ